MPAPAHIQEDTLEKFIEGWRKFTPESLTALWTDECTQHFLPHSLGQAPQTRDEVLKKMPTLMGILKNWKVEITETVHDAAKSKAALYAISTADTPFDNFNWKSEYALYVTFTEDGEKISKIEEMVDTTFYREFFPLFQKYIMEQSASK